MVYTAVFQYTSFLQHSLLFSFDLILYVPSTIFQQSSFKFHRPKKSSHMNKGEVQHILFLWSIFLIQ